MLTTDDVLRRVVSGQAGSALSRSSTLRHEAEVQFLAWLDSIKAEAFYEGVEAREHSWYPDNPYEKEEA